MPSRVPINRTSPHRHATTTGSWGSPTRPALLGTPSRTTGRSPRPPRSSLGTRTARRCVHFFLLCVQFCPCCCTASASAPVRHQERLLPVGAPCSPRCALCCRYLYLAHRPWNLLQLAWDGCKCRACFITAIACAAWSQHSTCSHLRASPEYNRAPDASIAPPPPRVPMLLWCAAMHRAALCLLAAAIYDYRVLLQQQREPAARLGRHGGPAAALRRGRGGLQRRQRCAHLWLYLADGLSR